MNKNNVNVTVKEFNNLNYFSLALLLISHPIVIEKLETEYRLFLKKGMKVDFMECQDLMV